MQNNQSIIDKFPTTGVKGDDGERFLFEQLLKRYEVVNDYRQNLTMQNVGVDFGFGALNWKRETTLDVKNNLYITRDKIGFKVEIQKNGKPGWFFTSKADRIYHVCAYQKKFMYYDLGDLRSYVFRNNTGLELVDYKDGKDVLIQFYHSTSLPVSQIFFV